MLKRFLAGLIALTLALPALADGTTVINAFLDTGATRLCYGEAKCFAIDATVEGGSVTVRDVVTPANNLSNVQLNKFTFADGVKPPLSGATIITQSSTSPKLVHWNSSPFVRSVPHNLLLQSQTLATGTWTTNSATLTNAAGVAPDGTTTAVSLVEGAATATHFTQSNIAVVAGLTYNISVYAKPLGVGSTRYVEFTGAGCSGVTECPNFDVVNGTVTLGGSSTIFKSATITAVGGSWYRLSAVIVASNTNSLGASLSDINSNHTGGGYSFAGDGTSGALLWGFQQSQGANLLPYHVTTASAWYGIPQGYDNTLSKFGLQIEPAVTNALIWSQDFTQAAWNKLGPTTLTGGVTAPDGSPTATLATESTNSAIEGTGSITSNTYSVYSVYLKRGNTDFVEIWFYRVGSGGADFVKGWFNTNTCSTGSVSNGGTGTGAAIAVQNVGNGWCRAILAGAVMNAGTSVHVDTQTATADASNTTVTNGTYNLWGEQLENVSSVATPASQVSSYIPTAASTVTRAIDDIQVALSTIPWSDTAGTGYVDFNELTRTVAHDSYLWEFAKDANNAISIDDSNNTGPITMRDEVASSVTFDSGGGGTPTLNARSQLAFAFANNDWDASFNGAAPWSATLATTTGYVTLYLGRSLAVNSGTGVAQAFENRFVYVPRQVQTGTANLQTWRYNF